ncbi:hypothetical protein CMU89_15185 [Elizabethkingia anophelis]|uniref:hypothetical protein n=1 Tax=Elizabethkingia anophelis TaxID=1117645 RepID=UPI00136EF5A4|nr:hypothetical protein [Elizabethkingia anophelis]MDV3508785.1 hypothetical protein [Elizabethkingia anophelis]MDV3543987.1 hypothetical protein [Elizabethkingia anophelis]MYY25676.1 hypothetical protein [Elizabethkingia anophelis]
MRTTSELKDIVELGGGITIDASEKTTLELKEIAKLANSSGATIIIRNTSVKTTSELKEIAKLAPGKVIFEIL